MPSFELSAPGMLALHIAFDPDHADGSRYVEEDLNRQWLPERIAAADTMERRRAAELAPHVAQADWLLDIHSMHEPSAPLQLTGIQPRNLSLARALGSPEHIVVDAGHKHGEPVATPCDDCVLVMPSTRQAREGVTVVRFARRRPL